jgi:hypothetical protein
MEIKPKSSRMYSFLVLYDMHTKFFINSLVDIKDEDAHNRLSTKANHVGWIAGSMAFQRFDMARELGKSELKASFDELFTGYKGIQENEKYPSMDTYKKEWEKISPVLREVYMNISDEKLDEVFEMEGMKMSYYELIGFMIHRESYMIGQLGLWRRLLGYPAMKYE